MVLTGLLLLFYYFISMNLIDAGEADPLTEVDQLAI